MKSFERIVTFSDEVQRNISKIDSVAFVTELQVILKK